jgi:hypothetical protein
MKLKIYFKSGNIVTTRNVDSWEIGCNSGSINSILIRHKEINFLQIKGKIIVKSINLDNVDCILEV